MSRALKTFQVQPSYERRRLPIHGFCSKCENISMRDRRNICKSNTNLMQRVSECELMVFCGPAARLRRAAGPCSGGGQPVGLAAANPPYIQKVFDCKWYKSKAWGEKIPLKIRQFFWFLCVRRRTRGSSRGAPSSLSPPPSQANDPATQNRPSPP